ncbi:MAG: hypothetical protein AAGB46_05970, partial [Verrucomicrobiota bacterium]
RSSPSYGDSSLSEAQTRNTDKPTARMGELKQAQNAMKKMVEARLAKESNLVTTRASAETQPLGRIMPAFFDTVSAMLARSPSSRILPHDVQRFLVAHERFLNKSKLENLAFSESIELWTTDRLTRLGVAHTVENLIRKAVPKIDQDIAVAEKCIHLCEDFMLVSKFCRELESIKVETANHQSGLLLLMSSSGPCESMDFRAFEDKGVTLLLNQYQTENAMKLQISSSRETLEMRTILYEPESRLGF